MPKKVQLTEEKLYEIIRSIVKKVLNETSACLGASYYTVRALAHDVKDGDIEAIDRASLIMMKYVPANSILIPIPSHTGNATYTLTLAKFIAKRTKSKVLDILSSEPRERLYNLKLKGVDMSKVNLDYNLPDENRISDMLHSTRNVILIDNVVDSGATYHHAKEALKKMYGVDAWMLSLGAVTNPKCKSYDVIRSTYRPRTFMEENETKECPQP